MIMTTDDLKNLPPLSNEEKRVIRNADGTPTEDCPEMSAAELKEFKPWYERTKKPVTINMDTNVILYFKNLSKETGVPYQTLINLYLSQCVNERKRPVFA